MPRLDNERRSDHDLRRVMDAIERVGRECQEQHVESQNAINNVLNNQTALTVKASGIESMLDRVGSKLDNTSERVAATDAKVETLRNHSATLFTKTNDLEGQVKVMASKGTDSNPVAVSFVQTDNFKWLVGAAVFVSLLVLLAFGSITVSEIKELNPIGGE